MSSKNSNFSYTDWIDTQRHYLDALSAIGQLFTGPLNVNSGKKSPMADPLEQWWKLIAPALPQGGNDLVSKLAEQTRLYFFMGEQFITLLNNIKEYEKKSDDWQSVLNKQFDEMKKLLESSFNTNYTMHDLCGSWQLLPLDTLQRTFSSASIMPGDFLEDLKPENLERVTDKFLSIPGVGYTRETQATVQTGIKLWNLYVKASNEFNNAMCKVGINALDAMQVKIINMAESGKEFNSLREVYDLWVDCNEEAYANFVFSEEYSRLNGKLTNALMAVKQHGRNLVDEVLGAMNMPTRRGINTMQKRQQEMRREQKDTNNKIESLQQEIKLLHEQNAVHNSPASKSASSAGNRKARKARKARKVDESLPARLSAPKHVRKKKAGIKTRTRKSHRPGKKNSKKDDVIIIKI